MSLNKCITQPSYAYAGKHTYINIHIPIHIQSYLQMTHKRPASYCPAGRTPFTLHAAFAVQSCVGPPESAAPLGGALALSSSPSLVRAASPYHTDAVGSWHIPDDFDRLSLTLARAAGAAAHDWHADGQKSSKPAVLTTRPSAASRLIGWWALW